MVRTAHQVQIATRRAGTLLRRGAPVVACLALLAACNGGTGSDVGEPASTREDPGASEAPRESATTSQVPLTTVCLDEPVPAGVREVIGRTDINADGVEEVWAVAGVGADVLELGVWWVDGCETVPVALGTSAAIFGLGGAAGPVAGGIRCGPASSDPATTAIYVASATSTDGGTTFDVATTEYSFDGTEVRPGPVSTGTAAFGDEAHTAASTFSCAGVTYVP